MSRGAQVRVAGAGALGLTCALALADAGCRVTLSDPSPQASASAVAAGMLAPAFEAALDPETSPPFDLLLAARDLWPALEARAGVALDRSGAMAVGPDAWLATTRAALIRLGLHGIELPRRAAQDLSPGLAEDVGQALLVREDWRLEPSQAMAALRAACEAAGVVFEAAGIEGHSGADWLVVSTGASRDLQGVSPELAWLSPIKGQIFRFPGAEAGRVSLRAPDAYAVAGGAGLAVGATMEPGVRDPTPDPAQAQGLLAAAARLFPALNGVRAELRAGVRAATPDGLPLAGLSSTEGVLLAAGARRNGWLLAPLVAQAVAACVTGGEAGPYAGRLDPRRFGEA